MLRKSLRTVILKMYYFHISISSGLAAEEVKRFRAFVDDPRYANTLIRKHLTNEILQKTAKITPSIMDCIEQSESLPKNIIGMAALNPDCYTHLAIIFEPIIEDYYSVASNVQQPNCQWGVSNEFEKFDDDAVQSVRIICRRSIGRQPFVIGANENQLTEILAMVRLCAMRMRCAN